MKKLLSFTLFILIAVPVFAQDWAGQVERIAQAAERDNMLNLNPNIEIEGTPYYNTEWMMGQVITNSGEVSEAYQLRYVILTNRLLILENGGIYIVRPEVINGFTFFDDMGKEIVFKKGFSSNTYDIKPDNYLKIIYDGKIKLVANFEVEKRREKEMRTGHVTLHFDRDRWYYLITSDGIFHEVDLEKDDILEALPGNNTKLQEYVEKLSLDYSNTKSLRKILSIYEQLAAKESNK